LKTAGPAPGLFDTHAHLCDPRFDPDREDVIRRSLDGGVPFITEIADSPEGWESAMALSRSHAARMRCALGLHPYYADRWDPGLTDDLRERAKSPEVAAIGEMGLDYVKSGVSPDVQKRAFLGMLEASRALGLPAVIHCRGAYPDMMAILREFFGGSSAPPGRRGVLHCFSGSASDAREAVRLGLLLGVDGPVTYPKNGALREAIAAAGLDHVVLETDSPYLPPQSRRGQRNDPSLLPEIARGVADIFNADVAEVARRTTENAKRMYGINLA